MDLIQTLAIYLALALLVCQCRWSRIRGAMGGQFLRRETNIYHGSFFWECLKTFHMQKIQMRLRFKNLTVTAESRIYTEIVSPSSPSKEQKQVKTTVVAFASERCFQAHRAPELDHGIFMASTGKSWNKSLEMMDSITFSIHL